MCSYTVGGRGKCSKCIFTGKKRGAEGQRSGQRDRRTESGRQPGGGLASSLMFLKCKKMHILLWKKDADSQEMLTQERTHVSAEVIFSYIITSCRFEIKEKEKRGVK